MLTSSLQGIHSVNLSALSATTVYVLLIAGEDDLREVILAVANLAREWMNLGIFLGLHQCDLDAISKANPKSTRDYLREMLSLWLKQNYDVRITPYTLPHFTKPTNVYDHFHNTNH